jgi:pimeloyl-ACP methyl ester carboxylesterase
MAGDVIQNIIDYQEFPSDLFKGSSNGKYFDIIGFDPRGVNNTTPTGNCFPDDTTAGSWIEAIRAEGPPHSNESFGLAFSRSKSIAQSCVFHMGYNDKVHMAKYVSTPSVVEDMVAIVEALGEWREKESLRLRLESPIQAKLSQETVERLKWKRGKEKLQYLDFSYGTLLGATFAAQHPDRVERIVLDGVLDAEDYCSSKQVTFNIISLTWSSIVAQESPGHGFYLG